MPTPPLFFYYSYTHTWPHDDDSSHPLRRSGPLLVLVVATCGRSLNLVAVCRGGGGGLGRLGLCLAGHVGPVPLGLGISVRLFLGLVVLVVDPLFFVVVLSRGVVFFLLLFLGRSGCRLYFLRGRGLDCGGGRKAN